MSCLMAYNNRLNLENDIALRSYESMQLHNYGIKRTRPRQMTCTRIQSMHLDICDRDKYS